MNTSRRSRSDAQLAIFVCPSYIFGQMDWGCPVGATASVSFTGVFRFLRPDKFLIRAFVALTDLVPPPVAVKLSLKHFKRTLFCPGLRTLRPIGRATRSANCKPEDIAFLSENKTSNGNAMPHLLFRHPACEMPTQARCLLSYFRPSAILASFEKQTLNAKLTGRTEPACRRRGSRRCVKFAKQTPAANGPS